MSRDREFSWKKNLSSFVTTSTALTLTIFCKGGWSQKIEGFTLTAPDSVSVQRGLCVHVPCTFTYKGQPQIPAKKLYAYWLKDEEQTKHYLFYQYYFLGLLVATNDERQKVHSSASGRFRFTGDPARGDCSFSINNAASVDQGLYYLRIDGGEGIPFSYRIGYTTPRVVVTETPAPEIQILGKLQAGQPVNMTCIVASCPWKTPNISWEFTRNISGILSSSSNGTKMSNVVPSFVPSAADNSQHLTCRVTYGSGSTTVISEKMIHLNVRYPPQRLQISGERRHTNGGSQPFTGSHTEAQEGDTLWLRCEAEGNPLPQATWVERPQSGTQHSLSGNQLTLSDVKLQDMGGYTCQVQNTEGTSETTFQVYMRFSPRMCSRSNTSCWREEDGIWCNCSICSYPMAKIQWVVNGKTVEGNASNKEMEVMSWYKTDEATSTMRLKGTWDGQRSVLCSGNSSSGETSANFFLYSFKAQNMILTENTIVPFLLGLSLIKFVFCFLIFSFVVWFSNRRKTPVMREEPSK